METSLNHEPTAMMALWAPGFILVGIALGRIVWRHRNRAGQPVLKRADEGGADAPPIEPTTISADPDALRHIRVVAFDAFGTLVQITDPRNLWRKIGQHAIRRVDARCVPGTLEEHVVACGVPWEPRWAAELEETLQTLATLRSAGYQLAIISNLSTPYVQPLRVALGTFVDAENYSCEVRAAKPQPAIFAALCAMLDVAPREILIVGDSRGSDIEGAQRFGIRALHLVRGAETSSPGSISSLHEVVRLLAARTPELP